jgi:tRNA-splicing ligase RtcB
VKVQLLKRKWAKKAHWVVAHSGLLGKIPAFENQHTIVHHWNFDKTNNVPANLAFMGDSDHSSFHRKLAGTHPVWDSPGKFQENRLAGVQRYQESEEGKEKLARIGTENFQKYMSENPEHYKESVKDNGKRGGKYLSAYNTSERGRAKSKEVANRFYTCSICGESGKSPIFLHTHRKKVHKFNHKIVKIEQLTETQDVYCLIVPEHHNFALTAGVFVHNCGIVVVKTSLKLEDIANRFDSIHRGIKENIPVGYAHRQDSRLAIVHETVPTDFLAEITQYEKESIWNQNKIVNQLGTLGGGNHFIELQLDEQGYLCIMIHSGSRNIGNKITSTYIKIAKTKSNASPNLEYLEADSIVGKEYLEHLAFATQFAYVNRLVMIESVKAVLIQELANFGLPSPTFSEMINIHHNYVALEEHFGEKVWVHRKGATRVTPDVTGLIPGSMGTASYIVNGTGNIASYNSCSHGAGRRMSRTAARGKIDRKSGELKLEGSLKLDDFKNDMNGVYSENIDQHHLDEAPRAYKDIDEVMANQQDLVNIKTKLRPILVVKG